MGTPTFSQFGKKEMQKHSLMPLQVVKLYVGEGEELTGHGYEQQQLVLDSWNLSTGAYPTLEWIFEADVPADVKGYFVTNLAGDIIMFEEFEEPQTIQHTGDKITIDLALKPIVKNKTTNG